MKKLCIGTLLRILCDAKVPGVIQRLFLSRLLSIVKTDSIYEESKYQSSLLSGKNNLTNYDEILEFDKEKLVRDFKDKLDPFFDESGKKLVIICLQDVIKEDTYIQDSDNIGFTPEGYTKQDIVNKQVFSFFDLLANIYYYCIINVKNIPYKDNIKEIKGYAASQKHRIYDVQLETKPIRVASKIKLTLDAKPFNDVFKEIKNIHLSIPNSNELKIYRLDVTNSRIDYTKLQDFIADNIGRYIYSRGRLNDYDLKESSTMLAIKALRAYNDRIKKTPSTNHFNEIMLYSFLECVLGAPKIFSKMELQDQAGVYDSLSSGIHINTINLGGTLVNQLVFGAADTVDNLGTAVDNALNQILTIKSSYKEEYELLERTILNNQFDTETNKTLESMIIPSEDPKLNRPDSAFGLFLGYTVNIKDEPDNVLYLYNLEKQMNSDVTKIAPYLENKINKLGLGYYSFYIYIVPLNNAVFDKNDIMKKALEVNE